MNLSATARPQASLGELSEPLVCFHCGETLTPGTRYRAKVGGGERDFCCPGCEAVASMIHEAGLDRFYERRTHSVGKPPVEPGEDWTVFDRPAIQQGWVKTHADGSREALLALEGMACGACAWLNEQRLLRLPGVRMAQVNFAAQRLRVQWLEPQTRLSEVMGTVAALGYRPAPFDAERADALARAGRRKLLTRLGIAGLGMMQVMMYAYPAYFSGAGLSPEAAGLMRWASMILTLPVVLYAASPFFSGAWRDLLHRRAGMDVPVALALLIAFGASVVATLRGQGEVYFDAVSMFVFLLLAARFYEFSARQKAAANLRLAAPNLPAVCTRLGGPRFEAPRERVAVAELRVGDHLLVPLGEVIPADGSIALGQSRIEEAQLTGEFWPVVKTVGEEVWAGSVNRSAPLVVRLTAVGTGTRLWAIGNLVDRALAARPRLAQIADAVAGRFVFAQLVLAALAGGVWLLLDPGRAAEILVAVLVVSCPCALSLAAPMALAVTNGTLAQRGLLITGAQALETLAGATDVVLDKTGTLSAGQPALREIRPLGCLPRERLLEIAARLEAGSRHPLASALPSEGVAMAEDWQELPGKGVEGRIDGIRYRLGQVEWVGEMAAQPIPHGLHTFPRGANLVALACPGAWQAGLVIDDAPRADAAAAVRELRSAGLRLHLVSGDRAEAVEAWADSLGISSIRAAATPQEKQAFVRTLQDDGRVVVMVGDGVNDTPGFAQAHAAVAMGSGAALAKETADAVLLGASLLPLGEGLVAARRCLKVLRQNLAWAFGYNLVAIPVAAVGWASPWIAAVGMAVSSMLVVLNAGRLARRGA